LIVHFFTAIFEYIPEVIQFRVIQDSIEEIIIEYIPDKKKFHTNILFDVETKIKTQTKDELRIVFKEVNNIPNTSSGKPQIVISKIK
jgi:hypothetical protein